MKIDTERLNLLPCTVEFLNNLIKGVTLVKSHQFSGEWLAGFRNFAPIFLQELIRDPSSLGWQVWMIVDKKRNIVIGDAGFKGRPDSNGAVEIGYGIGFSYRNQGFATEAVRGLIKWAFSHSEVKKIRAECYINNKASIRVLEKAGMEKYNINGNIIRWRLNR